MAAARERARHTSRTRCTRSCPQTFQCPARACSPAPPRVNARKRTKPPTTTTTTTTTTTNLLPGAVVYVAVSILENALTVLQVIQPLSLVHVTARKRFLALPAYYTASRTHHTSHITRHTSHVTRVRSGSTHHSRPCAAHPGAVVHDAVGVRQLALAVPHVVQVLPLVNVSIRKLVPAAARHKSHARTHVGLV